MKAASLPLLPPGQLTFFLPQPRANPHPHREGCYRLCCAPCAQPPGTKAGEAGPLHWAALQRRCCCGSTGIPPAGCLGVCSAAGTLMYMAPNPSSTPCTDARSSVWAHFALHLGHASCILNQGQTAPAPPASLQVEQRRPCPRLCPMAATLITSTCRSVLGGDKAEGVSRARSFPFVPPCARGLKRRRTCQGRIPRRSTIPATPGRQLACLSAWRPASAWWWRAPGLQGLPPPGNSAKLTPTRSRSSTLRSERGAGRCSCRRPLPPPPPPPPPLARYVPAGRRRGSPTAPIALRAATSATSQLRRSTLWRARAQSARSCPSPRCRV